MPITYYNSAQTADRLVALELCYNGTVRPMERKPGAGGVWTDVTGPYAPVPVPAAAPLSFHVITQSSAMCCVELIGWVPPYPDSGAYFMGQSWAFGMNEVDYAAVANSVSTSVRRMDFTFSSGGLLSWTAGTGPAVQKSTLQLDAAKLKFAYVVMRVTGANDGSIVTPGLAFTPKAGGAAKSAFDC